MENKIAFPQLVAMLALATGRQKNTCEDFLKEFFRLISDELARGESIRIKGFGTFKLVDVEARRSVNVATGESHEIPGHSKISFVPAKEMAALVNQAFEAFEAVEVADDVTMDELVEQEEQDPIQDSAEVMVGIYNEVPAEEPEPTEEPVSVVKPEPAEEPVSTEEPEPVVKPKAAEEPEPHQEVIVTECAMKSHKFGWGFFAGFMTALVAGAVALLFWVTVYFNSHDDVGEDIDIAVVTETPSEESDYTGAESVDSIAREGLTSNATEKDGVAAVTKSEAEPDVPTKPSDEKVYDTISTTRFLTTMAKEHYGNFNLWPIIYEENQAILGHPDRIKPGTQVVVPPLSKYGIDPKNAEDVKRVKAKGVAIYAKYK